MTSDEFLLRYQKHIVDLRLPFSLDDVLGWIHASDVTPSELSLLDGLFAAMVAKKHETAIRTLKKLSRIPQKSPLIFNNRKSRAAFSMNF